MNRARLRLAKLAPRWAAARGRAAAIGLALAGVVAAAPAAQEEPAPEALRGAFGEVLEVRVVNVEVVVTDRDGVPVRGLPATAFRLEVDGEETPIEYFTEVQGGQAVESGQAGTTGADLLDIPALVPGEPVGTSYLLFIDELFAIDRDRDQVLQEIAADLPLLGSADRMAVVAFDGRRLEMLSSWSGSPAALARTLEEARRRPAWGMQRLAERRRFEDLRPSRFGRHPFDGLDPESKAYALRLADQTERVVRAAAAALRGFAQPPGRRVLLLLSGGWAFRPSDFVTGTPAVPAADDLGLQEGDELYGRLTNTANRLGYTIYAVNVPGSFDRLEAAGAGGLVAESRRQELYSTFRYLARETGGRVFLGADRGEALSATVADTRSFYWLGFTPDRAWDEGEHDIRVRVVSPGLEVRSRTSFQELSRQAEVSMAVESALLFDALPASPELAVEIGAARKSGFQKVELPVTLALPLAALTFLPQGERWVANLELRFAVADEGFHHAEIPVVPVALESESAPGSEEMWNFTTTLRLRRRPQQLMVAVYDPPSGRILTHRVRLDL